MESEIQIDLEVWVEFRVSRMVRTFQIGEMGDGIHSPYSWNSNKTTGWCGELAKPVSLDRNVWLYFL